MYSNVIVGEGDMSEVAIALINALAPTVASKVIDVISKRGVEKVGMDVVLIAMMAEQNQNIMKGFDRMNENVAQVLKGINSILKEIKMIDEGIAVLLKRTES